MMQKIPLEQVTEEMVSAKNVRMPDGSCIIQAGQPFDATVLRRLERTGAATVVVQGRPVPGLDMGYDAERLATRMPHLFRNFQDDPRMMQFCRLLQKILAERYQ